MQNDECRMPVNDQAARAGGGGWVGWAAGAGSGGLDSTELAGVSRVGAGAAGSVPHSGQRPGVARRS